MSVHGVFAVLLTFAPVAPLQSQNLLINPSFEGMAGLTGYSEIVDDWHSCAQIQPDNPRLDKVLICRTDPSYVHSIATNLYEIKHRPADGMTFVSLIVRSNGSRQSVYQMLTEPLVPGNEYSFSIYASQAKTCRKAANFPDDPVEYKVPAILRMTAGNDLLLRPDVLVESEHIDHFEWKEYTFQFVPNKMARYIFIEAYFDPKEHGYYNGHVLIDNVTLIKFK